MNKPFLFLLATICLVTGAVAQDFPNDLFTGDHGCGVGIQFDDPASDKINKDSKTYKDAKEFIEKDLKDLNIDSKVSYLKASKGVGGISSHFVKNDVRCLLQFTFFTYPKNGGDRADYAGKLEILEVDEEGKKSSKSVRYTIGGDKGDKMTYTAMIDTLKKQLENQ